MFVFHLLMSVRAAMVGAGGFAAITAGLVITTLVLISVGVAPVVARSAASGEERGAVNRAPPIPPIYHNPPIYRLDPDERLHALLAQVRKQLAGYHTPRERAQLLLEAADLEVELGNYKQAIKDTKAAIDTGALTKAQKIRSYFMIGRLYLAIDPPDFENSGVHLEQYMALSGNPVPDAYFYLGMALAMQDKYREAIPHAQKAIERSGTPKESHYRLLLFCFVKLKRYRDQMALLERMAKLFPPRDEYGKYLEEARRKVRQTDD